MTTEQRNNQRVDELEAAVRAIQIAMPYETDRGDDLALLDMIYRVEDPTVWDSYPPATIAELNKTLNYFRNNRVDLFNKYEKLIIDAMRGKIDRDCQFYADYKKGITKFNENKAIRLEMRRTLGTMARECTRIREGRDIREIF